MGPQATIDFLQEWYGALMAVDSIVMFFVLVDGFKYRFSMFFCGTMDDKPKSHIIEHDSINPGL